MESKQLELTAINDRLEKAKAEESQPKVGTGPDHVNHLEEQVRKLEAQLMAHKGKDKKIKELQDSID